MSDCNYAIHRVAACCSSRRPAMSLLRSVLNSSLSALLALAGKKKEIQIIKELEQINSQLNRDIAQLQFDREQITWREQEKNQQLTLLEQELQTLRLTHEEELLLLQQRVNQLELARQSQKCQLDVSTSEVQKLLAEN